MDWSLYISFCDEVALRHKGIPRDPVCIPSQLARREPMPPRSQVRKRALCSDLERYRQFFGIVSDKELKEEADALKAKGDFTSPDSFKASTLSML